MNKMTYFDVDKQCASGDIGLFFPQWKGEAENIAVFSPHDDDAIIGAGYALMAARANHANTYVFIFCSGNAGYSDPALKDKIEDIRMQETIAAYGKLGIKKENIIYFGYSDFSVIGNIGWQVGSGLNGSFQQVLTKLRELKITRVLVPNHFREHADHTAVNFIGSYDSPQAGDQILMDWATPHTVKSVIEYCVWSDLSPEDALVKNRDIALRANRIILAPEDVEKTIEDGIQSYATQERIINDLIQSREERRINNGMYLEVYIDFDPRPKIDFKPYVKLAEDILTKGI